MERWLQEAEVPRSKQELIRRLLDLQDREATALILDLGYGMTRS